MWRNLGAPIRPNLGKINSWWSLTSVSREFNVLLFTYMIYNENYGSSCRNSMLNMIEPVEEDFSFLDKQKPKLNINYPDYY